MNTPRRGRPPINDTALGRRTVYLTADEVQLLSHAGAGNLSRGLRDLLVELLALRRWHRDRTNPTVVAGPEPRRRQQ